ncbi:MULTISPECIES: hypothetical protein [Nocardia]|uniref:Uncharacterized protein n=1 Tax=Nocardia asteroides NBRC 15531 TaxID=1110697 RepID=U5EID5_NOCAS|nr:MULTISPECIES: hypothetical protein [Nocardia]TLF63359.1 hypothetical protein FEK33_25315 [Nocardia asteroides NBRC 15531]UGT47216.1 hypothetical protein LT345_22210 [Nocardia asteroides]SFM76045.1 hypothetical protein SAMN05444423_104132 [Nocardia asteroides]VEG33900.1 Uncharacterised protein [Nocardia asteroides]GAD87060.1 hypothetical protein NCAST_34_01880 [Nocardia asteroides NBRC 15531]
MSGDELVIHTKAWMLQHGWTEVSEGPAGWMWKHTAAGGDARKIAIVRNLANDSGAFNGVVQRLAAAHGAPTAEVERTLKMWGTDVTMLRAANDIVIAETIPLTAAAVMVESARLMYRCSATAAIRLRPEISGGYSKIGDDLSNTVRMGHTERGSYVIPVYVKLSDPKEVVDNEQPFEGLERESVATVEMVESAERRMTRTFAQAMQAIHDHVLTPEHLPRAEQVMGLVSAGVTREFVSAITRVLAEGAVAEFETRFEWAPSQPTPTRIAQSVSIPAAAEEKLTETIRILKRSKRREFNVMTGPIVTVSKFPDDPNVYATIKTVRGGHPCNVTAILPSLPLKTVTEWMTSGETVQLQGVVDRQGGGLVVRSPQGFGPIALPAV